MKLIRFLALFLTTSLAAGAIVVLAVFAFFGRDLPDYNQLRHYEPSISTRLYAKDGKMFAEYAYEKRVFVPVNAIPERLKNAFIAVEDKNFYGHIGIDIGGIFKAIIRNIKRIKDSRRLAGASTITQQVARNFLLQDTARIVSWKRKIREMILSFRLEATFTKDHILELYLNEIFLGKRSYGVGSAALNYFNKGLDELTLAECAFLAALPKAPSRYSNDIKRARVRRDYVLERMAEEGYITEEEMKKAQAEPIKFNWRKFSKDSTVDDDYFAEEVRRTIIDRFGKESLYRDGLVVRSSMEPETQALASKALQQGLIKYDKRHGWRGALDNFYDHKKKLKAQKTKEQEKESSEDKSEKKEEKENYILTLNDNNYPLQIKSLNSIINNGDKENTQEAIEESFDVLLGSDELLETLENEQNKFADNNTEEKEEAKRDEKDEKELMQDFLLQKKPSKNILSNWQMAIVTDVNDNKAVILVKDIDREKENQSDKLRYKTKQSSVLLKDTKWARRYIDEDTRGDSVKSLHQVLKKGDIIYVEPVTGGENDGQITHHKLVQIPRVSGAIIVMNIHNGQVVAMSGGFNYKHSQFNRATQAMRQAGSTFKPFVALAALEKGLTPASLIDDSPISIYMGEGKGVWRPKNMSGRFYGPITLRRVIENSHNVATVRLVHEIVGIKPIIEIAQRFGIYDHLPPLISMVLGSGETTLLRLTSAFASLVNGGKKVTPSFIDRIQDRYGKTILINQKKVADGQLNNIEWDKDLQPPHLDDGAEQLTDPIYAYQIVSILEGAAIRGTSWKAGRALKKTIGGKTGTTNDSNTVWYIGFTPDTIVGVYVGFDTLKSLGKKESGSSVAMPIFVDFMKEYLKDKPSKPFKAPSGVKLIKVRRDNGKRPKPFGKGLIITEVFKQGYEPGYEEEEEKMAINKNDIDQITSGGLY